MVWMEVHFSLQVGPLEAEITADDEEDYKRELIQLIEFIQNQQDQLSAISLPETEPSVAGANSRSRRPEEEAENSETDRANAPGESTTKTAEDEGGPLWGLARRCGLSQNELAQIVDVDPQFEDPPLLLVDSDQLGDNVPEQQFTGTLLLLAVWEECYEESPVEVSRVKDGLEYAGISSANFYRMYKHSDAKQCFRRSGENQGATIRLTRAGERKAIERLEELS